MSEIHERIKVRVRNGNNPYFKSKLGLFLVIVSLFLYPIDVGSDINLAYHYYNGSWWKECVLTTSVIMLPTIINAIYLVFGQQRLNDFSQSRHWTMDVVLTLLLITPFLAIAKYLKFFIIAFNPGIAFLRRGTDEEILWLLGNIAIMGLVESFIEGIPQMILQVYIAANQLNDPNGPMGGQIWTSVYVAVVSSLVSCSTAICSAYKAFVAGSPLIEDDTKTSYEGLMLIFVGYLIIIAVRIGCLVYLMVTSLTWFIIFCTLHWMTMMIWTISEDFILSRILGRTYEYTFQFNWINCIFIVVRKFGSIFLFTYLCRIHGTKYWFAHCALLFIENFAINTLCYIYTSGGFDRLGCDGLIRLDAIRIIILPQVLYIIGTICLQLHNVNWREEEMGTVRFGRSLRAIFIQEIATSLGIPAKEMFRTETLEIT